MARSNRERGKTREGYNKILMNDSRWIVERICYYHERGRRLIIRQDEEGRHASECNDPSGENYDVFWREVGVERGRRKGGMERDGKS